MKYVPAMSELGPIGFAEHQIVTVRRQLLEAAAFGKHVSPDQLENMAGKLGDAVAIFQSFVAQSDPRRRD